MNKEETGKAVRYTWPWYVLGMVVLGILLAVLWMSHEVKRTRQQREFNSGQPQLVK